MGNKESENTREQSRNKLNIMTEEKQTEQNAHETRGVNIKQEVALRLTPRQGHVGLTIKQRKDRQGWT